MRVSTLAGGPGFLRCHSGVGCVSSNMQLGRGSPNWDWWLMNHFSLSSLTEPPAGCQPRSTQHTRQRAAGKLQTNYITHHCNAWFQFSRSYVARYSNTNLNNIFICLVFHSADNVEFATIGRLFNIGLKCQSSRTATILIPSGVSFQLIVESSQGSRCVKLLDS